MVWFFFSVCFGSLFACRCYLLDCMVYVMNGMRRRIMGLTMMSSTRCDAIPRNVNKTQIAYTLDSSKLMFLADKMCEIFGARGMGWDLECLCVKGCCQYFIGR